MKASETQSRAEFSNTSNDVPLSIAELSQLLLAITGGWPMMVNGALCYKTDDGLAQLKTEAALFAWIDGYANAIWSRGGMCISKEVFFEGLKQTAPSAAWATPHPHYPPLADVLYLNELPAPAPTGRLDELLDRFTPATPIDRELLKAAIVTPAEGLPPGRRPAFLLTSAQTPGEPDPQRGRGTGKTTLVDFIGQLYGGTFSFRSGSKPEQTLSDLLSPSALPLRVGQLDNLKSHRFSSEFFESLLTAPSFDGHMMYIGHGSRPNYITFFLTVNGAAFSKDMAQRSIPIMLVRPTYTAGWWRGTNRLVTDHREEIFADIGHFLSRPRRSLSRMLRWDVWCQDVVRRLTNPNAVVNLILERQGEVDEDDAQAEDVIDFFRARIRALTMLDNIDTRRVFVPTILASQWLSEMNRRFDGGQAAAYLKSLDHPRLQCHRTATARGFMWLGAGPLSTQPHLTAAFVHPNDR